MRWSTNSFSETKLKTSAASGKGIVRCLGIDGCLLVELEYAAGGSVQHGSTDAPTLLISLAGAAISASEPGLRLTANCSFFPAGIFSIARAASQGWRVLVVELHGSWAFELLCRLALGAPRGIGGVWVQRLAQRLYRELLNADTATPGVIRSLIVLIASELARGLALRERRPSWLDRVRTFIEDNYRAEVGVRELARAACVHPAHLSKAFSRAFGYTVREYVRCLRVEFARKQLESTSLTLSEIAVSAGFADQSHFTKTFKREIGKSPSRYRQALKPDVASRF